MFKFDEYTVKFQHVTTDGAKLFEPMLVSKSTIKRLVDEGRIQPYKAKTICTIYKDDVVVALGIVWLSWFDKFDQQFAVEKSFARAIVMLYPVVKEPMTLRSAAKSERRKAWVEFAKHHKSGMGPLTEEAKAVNP